MAQTKHWAYQYPALEKGIVAPQDTDPDLCVSVQEHLTEAWVGSGLLQGWGH